MKRSAKQIVVVYWTYYPRIGLIGTEEKHEIRAEHLPAVNPERQVECRCIRPELRVRNLEAGFKARSSSGAMMRQTHAAL